MKYISHLLVMLLLCLVLLTATAVAEKDTEFHGALLRDPVVDDDPFYNMPTWPDESTPELGDHTISPYIWLGGIALASVGAAFAQRKLTA